MSDILNALNPIGAIMGGVGGLVGGIGQTIASVQANQQNQANYEQSRWDAAHAVQTRAKDMAAAGINPLLAAGSPAQAMSGAHIDPVNMTGIAQAANAPIDAMRKSADIGGQLAQNDLIVAQAEKTKAEAQWLWDTMPNRKSGLEADVEYKNQTLPTRIAAVQAALTGQDMDNMNKQMDNLVKSLGLDATQVDMEYKKALTQLAKNANTMDKNYVNKMWPLELQAKGIAVRQLAKDETILDRVRQIIDPSKAEVLKMVLDLSGKVIGNVGGVLAPMGKLPDTVNKTYNFNK